MFLGRARACPTTCRGSRVPTTVRPRTATDLATCVRVLADVHRADGYPMAWPADPSSWLSPDGVQGAWVAESGGTPVGHAVVTGPGDDARPAADRLVALSRLFVAPHRRGDGVAGTASRRHWSAPPSRPRGGRARGGRRRRGVPRRRVPRADGLAAGRPSSRRLGRTGRPRADLPGVPVPRPVGPRAQRSAGRAASGAHGGGVQGGQHLVRLPHPVGWHVLRAVGP